MKDQHEFDEQVRRKMEEREFAFRESDWLAAQQLIERSRQRKGAWSPFLIAGVALLIIGAGTWWYNVVDAVVEENGVTVIQGQEHEVLLKGPIMDGKDGAMLETGSGAKRAITIGNGANATNGTSEVNREEPLTSQPTVTKNTSADLALQPGNAVMGSRSTPSDDGIRVSMIDDQHALDMKTSSTRDDVSITVEVDRPDTDHSTENASTDQDISALVPVVAGFVGSSMDALLGSPAVDTSDADDKAMDINSSETGLSQEGSVSGSTDHVTDPGSAPKDSSDRSAAEATPTLTQDSVSTATDPLLAAAAGPSPWEISAMVGAILTGSAYSGSNSADWTPGLSDRWTTTAGAEVMHLGRNFGIGTGVHYSTYEDHLHVDERTRTSTVIMDSNYFQPTEVTLLYVVGNVQINGQDYYVTQYRDTVIDVLLTTTTSSTGQVRLIDARDVVLSASYFEIPLLLDAHVTQGPWAIGLRGGPTFGSLSGRKGLVPNSSFDGYESFGEQQFRSTVFGLTARAYVRYRFSPGWSVGLEPCWRGQLSNAMENGDPERRSSGAGILFSLNYRLK